MKGAPNAPTIAPKASNICVSALAIGFPFESLSAHNGIHCTDPHVPIRATDANKIATKVTLISPPERISCNGLIFDFSDAAIQRFDSGTRNNIKKTKSAGKAPTSIIHLQESTVTG